MLGMIWAQGHDRAIGQDGTMAWHLPEDMAFFKEMTTGHPVIMGRKTWESLGEKYRPLPGRENFVITRNADYAAPGGHVFSSVPEAYAAASTYDDLVWVMGGAEIYRSAIDDADLLVVTDIDLAVPEADAFAPEISPDWTVAFADPDRGWHTSRKDLNYRFTVYSRTDINVADLLGLE